MVKLSRKRIIAFILVGLVFLFGYSLTVGPMSHLGQLLLYKVTGHHYRVDYTTNMTDSQLKESLSPEEYQALKERRQ